MIDIEEKLNNLPKGKLSKRVDWHLRFSFLKLRWQVFFNKFSALSAARRMAPIAIAVVLLLSLVCLPYYAYASEDVVRGNVLYPIKQSIEKIELSLADTPAKKADVYTKLAERRLEELEKLSNGDSVAANDNLAATIDEITVLTVQASSEAEDKVNTEEKKQQIEDRVAQIKEKQLDRMEKIANKFGLRASDNLLDSLAVNIDDLKKDKQAKNIFSEVLSEIKISTSSQDYKNFVHSRASTSSSTVISTSTIVTKPGRASIKIDQKIIAESWSTANDQVTILKNNIIAEGIENAELDDLFGRLDDRLNKAQAAIKSGNFNQADGLIKSTEALSNNAKHFLHYNIIATSTIRQATSSSQVATSSINNWRGEMEKRIKDMRDKVNNRQNK